MNFYKDFKKIFIATVFGCLMLFSLAANAGAPQGHLDSIEGKLRNQIINGFENLGRGNVSPFSEVAKSFLWDHRKLIRSENVSKSHQADAIVCIMIIKYDFSGFDIHRGNTGYMDWCQSLIRSDSQ